MTVKWLLRRVGLLLLFPALMAAQTSVPATPAGRTLQAWLDMMSSGDRAKVEEYVKTIDPHESVDGLMSFHDQTGGFRLLGIESSEPLHIRFRVREKNGSNDMIGVPWGRPINPVTKKDWEGTGVEPDVKVPADDALTTAVKLATEKIQAQAAEEAKPAGK